MSRISVKVCQIDTLPAVKMAAGMGADYVGLHAITPSETDFYPARRALFPRIAEYCERAMRGCRPVLLTKSEDARFVARACAIAQARTIQLHGPFPHGHVIEPLKREFLRHGFDEPPELIKVIQVREGISPASVLEEIRLWLPHVVAFLFDSAYEGGTGETIRNWSMVREAIAQLPDSIGTFIAGGISGENAAAALDATRASGVDAQSRLEIKYREVTDPDVTNRKSLRNPHVKDPRAVCGLIAAARGSSPDEVMRSYREARSRPRLLFSPSELESSTAKAALVELAYTDVDGVQVDGADGSAGVESNHWRIGVEEWAALVFKLAPEMPLWLHLFSNDDQWIANTVRAAIGANPHVVGVFLQDGRPALEGHERCARIEQALGVVHVLSMTSRAIASDATVEQVARLRKQWQITAPEPSGETPGDADDRAERVAEAVEKLTRSGGYVHLDRSVGLPLLRTLQKLGRPPHGATAGRGLLGVPLQQAVDEAIFRIAERS